METKYKDSGIEWIGKIPESWEVDIAKHVFKQRRDKGNMECQLLAATQKYGMYPQHLLEGVVKVAADTDLSQFKTVHKNDYVISLRSFQGGFEMSDYEGVCSPAYQVFYATRKINNKYYKYLFKSDAFIQEINSLTVGIREGKNILYDDFILLPIPIPTVIDQQRITDYLDAKCGEIDSLIGLQEQMIEKLKAYKQSVITEAVTKGLNPNAKLVPSGIDWIGEIPEEWKTVRLKEIGNLYGGLTGKKGTDFEVDEEDRFAYFIPFTNIFNNMVIDTSKLYKVKIDQGEKQNEVNKGDLLFLMSSEDFDGIGKPALLDESIPKLYLNSFCKGMRIKSQNVSPKFLLYMMTAHIMREQIRLEAKGFIRINLRQDKLMNVVLFLPPLSEQHSIASYLDEKCADIDRMITLKQRKIESLKDYKKSVIYEAVTGKTIIE